MRRPNIIVTDVIDRPIEEAIGGGLASFNDAVTGISNRRPLAVVVRDPETNDIVGGAIGRSYLGVLSLDLFHLPKPLRGSDLGSEILRMFEEEGRQRGCRSALLNTYSFQAPAFYERNGWRRFGEIACDPPGNSRVFMTKEL